MPCLICALSLLSLPFLLPTYLYSFTAISPNTLPYSPSTSPTILSHHHLPSPLHPIIHTHPLLLSTPPPPGKHRTCEAAADCRYPYPQTRTRPARPGLGRGREGGCRHTRRRLGGTRSARQAGSQGGSTDRVLGKQRRLRPKGSGCRSAPTRRWRASVSPSCTRPERRPAAKPGCRGCIRTATSWCSGTVTSPGIRRQAPDCACLIRVRRPTAADNRSAPA